MFTNEYIEKAIKAKEIQKLCKYKKGDWFIDPKNIKYLLAADLINYQDWVVEELEEDKWLPTLEDLFGIAKPIFSRTALELNYVVIGDKVEVLIGKCDSEGCGLDIEFTATSLETGLLRAIMAYEYNKSWNGKEWEEINGS